MYILIYILKMLFREHNFIMKHRTRSCSCIFTGIFRHSNCCHVHPGVRLTTLLLLNELARKPTRAEPNELALPWYRSI